MDYGRTLTAITRIVGMVELNSAGDTAPVVPIGGLQDAVINEPIWTIEPEWEGTEQEGDNWTSLVRFVCRLWFPLTYNGIVTNEIMTTAIGNFERGCASNISLDGTSYFAEPSRPKHTLSLIHI